MTAPADWLAIDWLLAAITAWIAIGAAGMVRPHGFYVVARILFPLGALVSITVAVCAAIAVAGAPRSPSCRWACPACRFTCGSTRFRLSSC